MRILRSILFRFRALFDRRALDAELERELNDHLARETRANVARGMSAADAARAARAAFGGVQHIKEDTREAHGMHVLDHVVQDLRYAARSLRRTPAFCLAVIVTLGAGIGVNAAMFGILDRVVLSPPTGIGDPANVSHLMFTASSKGHDDVFEAGNYPWLLLYRDALRPFGEAAQYLRGSVPVERGERGWIAESETVTGNYFALLRATPELGRFFAVDDEASSADPGIVLSYGTWRARFGARSDILGQRIWIQGHAYPVIGVTRRGFTGAGFARVDLWLPVAAQDYGIGSQQWRTNSHTFGPLTIVRLRPGANADAATTALARVEQSAIAYPLPDPPTYRAGFISLAGVRAGDMTLSPESRVTEWLFAVSLIVCVIACANVSNLFLLRTLSRRQEIAVRRALGVSRVRLAAAFTGESILLAFGGVAAALGAVWVGGPRLRAMLVPGVDWTASPVDLRVLAVGLACALACALAAGVLPLLAADRFDVSDALKTTGHALSTRRLPVQRALLILQSGLSLLLLVGAGLFVRSLAHARAIRLGFDGNQVIMATINFPPGADSSAQRQTVDLVRSRLQSLPGVEQVAQSVGSPFGSIAGASMVLRGDPPPRPGTPAFAYAQYVSPEFFAALGMRVIAGRSFTSEEASAGARVAVVSEAIARAKWPTVNPIGQCFWTWASLPASGAPCTVVVGVVETAHQFHLVVDSMRVLYYPLGQADASDARRLGALVIVRSSGPAQAMIETVRRTIQATSSSLPAAKVETLQSRVEPLLWQWKLGAWMFPLFGGLALLVASVGMYSVLAYSTTQRKRELAVRSALGAGRESLVLLVLRGEMVTVAAGLVLGLVTALTTGRFLRDLLLGTSPADPLTILIAIGALLLSACIASVIPAWRAARADPIEALRAE
ncbi:MAG: ADOP family duplicated permease [Gemmatimonadales bacterium]